MKIKDSYILRQVGTDTIVVPVGQASRDFHGMIKLNQTAADIWDGIRSGLEETQIINRLCEKYEVDDQTAGEAVRSMIQKMQDAGILE